MTDRIEPTPEQLEQLKASLESKIGYLARRIHAVLEREQPNQMIATLTLAELLVGLSIQMGKTPEQITELVSSLFKAQLMTREAKQEPEKPLVALA